MKPIEAVTGPDDSVAVRVDVKEAAWPLRLSLYLDGDLVDTWVQLRGVRGRHVVTARAIDARGRWGGASASIDVPSS